ncbi:MAG: IS66 family insertion sequence element accessory protein TnpB [Ilumatobacteraceae bacterium]|nr:IS66 family insertion sequence element accessory protein TnpB [Ilumatobacteraceae bacterium]
MLTLPTSVQIYLARGPTDMRKAIDGLAALTTSVLEKDPMSGHLFVFCNRRRDRIKILYWEQSGFWLLHKRLEKGTFAWPVMDGDDPKRVEMSASDLAALLSGLDVQRASRRRWYSRST